MADIINLVSRINETLSKSLFPAEELRVRAEGQPIGLTGNRVASHPAGRRAVFVQEPEGSDESFTPSCRRMRPPKR
jgi:hypothetical protein